MFLEELPQTLNLSVKLDCEGQTVELAVSLPHLYPAEAAPEVYVRSDHFSRTSQARLNSDLQAHLASQTESQEACLLSVISWAQDHQHLYLATADKPQEEEEAPVAGRTEEKFSRYWIYSHHIYSKVKRKNILDLAAQYCLTGFCLPGKPGGLVRRISMFNSELCLARGDLYRGRSQELLRVVESGQVMELAETQYQGPGGSHLGGRGQPQAVRQV